MVAGHDLLLVIIAIADGHLTIQLLQQFQAEGIIAVCLLKNPKESYYIQFLNDQLLPVMNPFDRENPHLNYLNYSALLNCSLSNRIKLFFRSIITDK